MKQRIVIPKVEPEAYKALAVLSNYVEHSNLTKTHKELIKISASQINGCAYCIDMHTKDARKAGETEQRIYALNAWRETPFFTDEERTILALTEEVTLIQNQVSEETNKVAADFLDEHNIVKEIKTYINISAWNRVGIATGMQPGL